MGIRFLAIIQLFFNNRAEIFYGNSGNYYPSIANVNCEINVMALNFRYKFLGPFWLENGRGRHTRNPTKNLAHVGVLLVHFLSQNRVP